MYTTNRPTPLRTRPLIVVINGEPRAIPRRRPARRVERDQAIREQMSVSW